MSDDIAKELLFQHFGSLAVEELIHKLKLGKSGFNSAICAYFLRKFCEEQIPRARALLRELWEYYAKIEKMENFDALYKKMLESLEKEDLVVVMMKLARPDD